MGLEGGGLRLDGSGRESLEGAEELGTSGEDSGTGGRQPTYLGNIFQGGSAGGSFIRVGGVGDDPPHGTIPGKLPKQGRQADYGESAKEKVAWGLGVTTAGDSYGGGRV